MANPTALYSFGGQVPEVLPERIVLSNGTTRTDVQSFTEDELADAGFTGPYEVPSYDQSYQRILWNSDTLSFIVEDISDDELWDGIRRERNKLLAESDWTMVADAPGEINLAEWTKYRQRLRDIPSYYSTPKEVVFPLKPSEQESFDLEPITELRLRWRVEDLENELRALKYRLFSPFPSWTWNNEIEKWEAPVAPPADYDGSNYIWSEIYQEWRLLADVEKSADPTLDYPQ